MFADLSYEPFKEPKGFLKLLQWIFAICAFATTVNFSTTIGFDVHCNNTEIIQIRHQCQYPFTNDEQLLSTHYCNGNATEYQFYGNERSNSEFFVTTGVLSFLYATILIVVFLFSEKLYSENPKAPIVDFFITLVFAVFWLSASSAWAHGRGNLVDAAESKEFISQHEKICNYLTGAKECTNFITGSYAGITISYLFGFINFILWAANLWFLYKETTWFESIMKTQSTSNAASSSGAI